ncbi:MAG: alpha/beta hydrolase [Bacteriovoracaceae bacterium]|nr:alpha/beta hydrolase [Bacteriovoracaceae bacterium]
MKFSLFSAPDLQSHKSVTVKGGWQVNYLAFAQESFPGRSPLVILGGAFQKFHSFKKEVEQLSVHLPVILVDLPGQGSNDQEAKDIGFDVYADILASFLDELKIPKITPVALSYGSAIGFTFAGKYPEKTDRLILGGTTPKLRKSVRILLEESLIALDEGRLKDFSTGVILNLFNYSQRKRTRIPRMLIRGFHKSLMALSENDKDRYRSNTQRLLDLDGLVGESPTCETLVIAGEYDNFTTPSECLAVANRCTNVLVAVLRDCDHLAPFVKKELMINTYKEFALDGKIYQSEGIHPFYDKEIPIEKKILEPRWLYEGPVILKNPTTGWQKEVKIIDLNSYGVCINYDGEYLGSDKLRDLRVELPDENLSLETIFFDSGRKGLRGVFKRYDFDTYDRVEKFIKKLGDKALVFIPAPL